MLEKLGTPTPAQGSQEVDLPQSAYGSSPWEIAMPQPAWGSTSQGSHEVDMPQPA